MDTEGKERFAEEFYSRQVILKELGHKGQKRLGEAKVAVVGVGGLLVIQHSLSVGELVAFIGYNNFLLMPIFMMGMIGAMLSRAEVSAKRVFEVLDAQVEVRDKENAVPLPAIRGTVTFDKVGFRYFVGGEDVLKDVTFTARPGQAVAIL